MTESADSDPTKSEVATALSAHSTSSSCSEPSLQPGEFLHDLRKDDMSLVDYGNYVTASNVFRLFFQYTTVITADCRHRALECAKHPNLNRYADIPCFDYNRVPVKTEDGTHDYIHASYIDGFREPKRFILTQAPLKETLFQFWEMVWSEKTVLLVSMTPLVQTDATPHYIPIHAKQTLEIGKMRIEHCGTRHIRGTYDATILKVTRLDNPSTPPRHILHLCYYSWPDKGTPTRPSELLKFHADILHNQQLLRQRAVREGALKEEDHSPMLVHCHAGVGRSSTLVAFDICAAKLDESAKQGKPKLSVEDVVIRLRSQRALAIQKPEQFVFLHLALLEYAIRKKYFEPVEAVEIDLSGYLKENI